MLLVLLELSNIFFQVLKLKLNLFFNFSFCYILHSNAKIIIIIKKEKWYESHKTLSTQIRALEFLRLDFHWKFKGEKNIKNSFFFCIWFYDEKLGRKLNIIKIS